MKIVACAIASIALFASASAFAANNAPLMKKFSDEFDPMANTADFIEACRIAQVLHKQKLTDEQAAVGLTCLGVFSGVAGVFDGSPKFTLDDGHSTVSVCPQGKGTYLDLVNKALEMVSAGEIDTGRVTPAYLALGAVLKIQACPEG